MSTPTRPRAAWALVAAWLLSLAGCVVVDAPETIEELVVFGFEHHTASDAHRQAFAEALFPLVEAEWDGLGEGYRVDNLTVDHLAAVGVENPSTETILGALGAATYEHGVDEVLWGITHPDKASVFDNYEAFTLVQESDRACFLARECAEYTQVIDQTVRLQIVGSARTVMHKDHRWVEPADGEPFVIGRTLVPDPIEFANPLADVHQQYDLFLIFPRDGGAARVETFWIDATVLDLELPDYYLVEQAVQGMADQAERIDELIDDEGS